MLLATELSASKRHVGKEPLLGTAATESFERAVTQNMLLDPHTRDVIEQFHAKDPRFNPEYDLESAAACWRFKPEWVAGHISPRPVLMVYAEHDLLVPVAEQLECYEALGDPKKLVKIPGAQHYDSYYFCNPKLHEFQKVEALDWYKKYL